MPVGNKNDIYLEIASIIIWFFGKVSLFIVWWGLSIQHSVVLSEKMFYKLYLVRKLESILTVGGYIIAKKLSCGFGYASVIHAPGRHSFSMHIYPILDSDFILCMFFGFVSAVGLLCF